MQVELTVVAPNGEQDVLITAPEHARLADVLPELARATGLPPGIALRAGLRELAPGQALDLHTGEVIGAATRAPDPTADALLEVRIVGGPNAGLTVPVRAGPMRVGRAPDCEIRLTDPNVSRQHAVFEVGGAGITLRDCGSANGTWVDRRRVGVTSVPVGAPVRVGDSLITVTRPTAEPAATRPGPDGSLLVSRPPTPSRQWAAPEIDLPQPDRRSRPRGIQWLAAALPAGIGGLLAWIWDAPQFLLFAALSPAAVIATAFGDRWHWRRSRRRAATEYRRRRALASRQITAALDVETRLRHRAAPDPVELSRAATLPGSRLWERHQGDDDFLRLRLGTGRMPSTARTRLGGELDAAGVLDHVPLCADLRAGPLGIGVPAEQRAGLARWLVAQLAALHAPSDLELVLLLPGPDQTWAWARWLPHLRGRVGSSGAERIALLEDLAARVDQGSAERHVSGRDWRGPWYVLVIDRAAARTEGLRALLAHGRRVGVTAICIEDDAVHLPAECTSLVMPVGDSGTRAVLRRPGASTIDELVMDQVSDEWAASFARALAPLVDAGCNGEVHMPESCQLLPLLRGPAPGPHSVTRRWASSTGSARTVLGIGPDGPLTLDLVHDGPHMLIAGTTGAGKSELLRTLVIGLAVEQPPEEMTFLLIDYKGGAAFAECADLPHTVGLVTDLDQHLTARVLRSLRAEVRRRERLFADVGADDLASYRVADAAEPLPRLVVAVDEFAALAEELPGFVDGLIAIAQRGRSLGLHLVLATQRPGHTVSADIRANTSLRICLRVTDPAESQNVIEGPEAAFIGRGTPGRGYLRRGADLTPFQAAYASSSSPSTPDAVTVEVLGPWRQRLPAAETTPSDLAVLCGLVNSAFTETDRSPGRRPWHPPIPETLARSFLPEPSAVSSILLGLVDQPDQQRQEPFAIDLARGSSLLIVGASRSGRSTTLASAGFGAAAHLAPDELTLYVVDAHGGLAEPLSRLPHCATVLGRDDLPLVSRLLRRLAGRPPTGAGSALLLIDDWPAVAQGLDESTAAECTATLSGLLRGCPSTGLTVLVSGDRSILLPRFAANFDERILLRMADRSDYTLAGVSPRAVPNSLPPGRGVRAGDEAVLQVADPGPFDDAARAAITRWPAGARTRRDAVRIRPLPTDVQLSELPQRHRRLTLGIGGDEGEDITVAPFEDAGRLLVAGPPRSGRSNLLRLLLIQALAADLALIIAAPPRSGLAIDARRARLRCLGPDDREIPPPPEQPTLLLVDDCEAYHETAIGDQLSGWLRKGLAGIAAAVAGRADDLAISYRGLGAEARRQHCGVLLRPGPLDGELLGVRLSHRERGSGPGRGVVVGPPTWGAALSGGGLAPIQVARA